MAKHMLKPSIILEIFIFAAHNVLTEEDCPEGYLLLRALRCYLEHDMHVSFEQHTEHTLRSGHAWLLKFGAVIQVMFHVSIEVWRHFTKANSGLYQEISIEKLELSEVRL